VIPATQRSAHGEVVAIASRDQAAAREAAARLGIPRAYGSYQALLDDPEVDAVYNPLPNHLHVPWSLRALDAGKHVLCEKPLAVTADEAGTLRDAAARHPRLRVMEAFMYRFHPQWSRVRALLDAGALGEVRAVHATFTYHNVDPADIRNVAEWGGGGLLDIGCYCISASRWIFGGEPLRALGMVEHDPRFGTDRLASGILDFGGGRRATLTCATQLAPHQGLSIAGTEGRIELEWPFTPKRDQAARIRHHHAAGTDQIVVQPADQYALQADAFARAVLDDTPVPIPLDDAVANLRAIEAVAAASRAGGWAEVGAAP
jgi:predicted dehydrogenase